MTEKVLFIVISGLLVVAVGSLIILSLMRRYRRELGEKQEEPEKTSIWC